MSLRGGRRAGLARCGLRAVAGLHQHLRQCARRSGVGLSGRRASAARRAVERHGVHQQLSMVRRRRAQLARLGVCGLAQLSVSGCQCAIDQLRHGDRPADRDVLDRHVLGQLLSRPSVVRAAIALGASSAAAASASRRGSATGRTSARRTAARRTAAGTRWWKAAGRSAARTRRGKAAGRPTAGA